MKKIDHIGIAVKDLDSQICFYRDIMGMKLIEIEELPERHLRVAVFLVGDVHIELLYPTNEDSPVGKFIASRGEGLHHIAYEVEDIEKTISMMKSRGIRMIDDIPKPGASHSVVAFMHPGSTGKVLSEICQQLKPSGSGRKGN